MSKRRVLLLAAASLALAGARLPARASGPPTLEAVNAHACRADADCQMTTLRCQSGCSGVAVNAASPLFAEFERQRLAADPCCRPGSQCKVTACVQQKSEPLCVQKHCTLGDRKPVPTRLYLSARAHHQCSTDEDIARVVESERARLAPIAGLVLELRAAPGLFVLPAPDACRPDNPAKFFERFPFAGKEVWLKSQEAQCKSCDCFAPIYFCVKAAIADPQLADLGYAPVSDKR
jgi:hypothetical protein